MCGIAGGTRIGREQLAAATDALTHRGPDAAGVVDVGPFGLAHTRLAIRDLDSRSNQPFRYGATVIVYNGELWNAEQVSRDLVAHGCELTTTGDTEVVAAALDTWGVDALPRLDGMWAVAWVTGDGPLRLATDRYGETPVHAARHDGRFVFASELKALPALGVPPRAARHVEPGCVVTVTGDGDVSVTRWYTPPVTPQLVDIDEAAVELRRLLDQAVQMRTVADVPIACLLSGGIDSAATLALLQPRLPDVVAYIAVHDPRSRDLQAARLVARDAGVPLVEVPVPAPTGRDLARVVAQIEQPHKAQVEIGWACLHLADALRADGARVVYSGEGSDELWASYGFAYHGIRQHGWYRYRRRLFYEQHRKNFARVNKVFLAAGVEPRMPFLDRGVVEYALTLPQRAVRDGSRPKAVLERAVADLLPTSITRRPKLAFQDGAGLKAACAAAVADPRRFYRAEYDRLYA